MKTALISLSTATLLGLASRASGHSFDAAAFVAILFASGLVAWTFGQYARSYPALTLSRPMRLPVNLGGQPAPAHAHRLAA
jgi:hypothetical protein